MEKMAQLEPVRLRQGTEVEKGSDIAAGMAGPITCKIWAINWEWNHTHEQTR